MASSAIFSLSKLGTSFNKEILIYFAYIRNFECLFAPAQYIGCCGVDEVHCDFPNIGICLLTFGREGDDCRRRGGEDHRRLDSVVCLHGWVLHVRGESENFVVLTVLRSGRDPIRPLLRLNLSGWTGNCISPPIMSSHRAR